MFARLLAWWPLVAKRRMRAAVEEWKEQLDELFGRFRDSVNDRLAAEADRDRCRDHVADLAGYLYRAIQAGDRAVELAEAADLAVGHWQDTAAELDKDNRKVRSELFAEKCKRRLAESDARIAKDRLRRIRLAAGTN